MLISAYDMCSTQSASDLSLFVDIHIEKKKTKFTSSSIVKDNKICNHISRCLFRNYSLGLYDYYYY